MSADNVAKSFPWPKTGKNSEILLLPLNELSDGTLNNALSFLSENCYYYNERNQKKYIKITGSHSQRTKKKQSIELERLFGNTEKNDIGELTEDFFRFQSGASSEDLILDNEEITEIYTAVQNTVRNIDGRYVPRKMSVLYSKPGGSPQGLHEDDWRNEDEILKQGEMLSAIVALQDGTLFDILGNKNSRKQISIPCGYMILFSGRLIHGGAAYQSPNIRLHFYFTQEHTSDDISVGTVTGIDEGNTADDNTFVPQAVLGLFCPCIDSCKLAKDKIPLTSQKLQDHWKNVHRKVHNMTLKTYIAHLNGNARQCKQCSKVFVNYRSLRRHKLKKCNIHH